MKIYFNNFAFNGMPAPVQKTASRVIRPRLDYYTIRDVLTLNETKSQKGCLDEYTLDIMKQIEILFDTAHSLTKSASKAYLTRTKIRSGYPNKKIGVAGSQIIEFIKIGPKGEDVSINFRVEAKKRKAICTIGDNSYIISRNGQIEQYSSDQLKGAKSIRQKGTPIQYCTQDDINNLEINKYLRALKNELEKYIKHIQTRKDNLTKFRAQKADGIPGTTEKYQSLIDSIKEKYLFFKKHIRTSLLNTNDQHTFKILNKIKTHSAQRSILFKDASPDGRSILLLYSTIKRKEAIRVLIMDYYNKKVDESYILYDGKLVKYFPKKPNDRPCHLEYDLHYYTQEEIDNSNLEYYLKILDKRLEEVNRNLQQEISERRKRK